MPNPNIPIEIAIKKLPDQKTLAEAIYNQYKKDFSQNSPALRADFIDVPSGWFCRKNKNLVDTTVEYIFFDYLAQGNVIGLGEMSRKRINHFLQLTFSRSDDNADWADTNIRWYIEQEVHIEFWSQDLTEHSLWRYARSAYVALSDNGIEKVASVTYQLILVAVAPTAKYFSTMRPSSEFNVPAALVLQGLKDSNVGKTKRYGRDLLALWSMYASGKRQNSVVPALLP